MEIGAASAAGPIGNLRRAGIVFAPDGDDTYYSVILDRIGLGILKFSHIVDGSTSTVAYTSPVSISQDVTYTIKVSMDAQQMRAEAYNGATLIASVTGDPSDQVPAGRCGLYNSSTNVSLDNFRAYHIYETPGDTATAPQVAGAAKTSITGGKLLVEGEDRGAVALVDRFSDDDYMIQCDIDRNP